MTERRYSPARLAVLGVALLASACGGGAIAEPGAPSPAASKSNPTTTTVADTDCPVTLPNGFQPSPPEDVIYTKDLPAPTPYPVEYPHEGLAWHGTEELWTALPIDGQSEERKSVWWSTNFPGGTVEERPEVHVTWTRLDGKGTLDNGGEATNAYTAEEGWFMIAGIDPDEPGCWQVDATYKGATLSFVYEQP